MFDCELNSFGNAQIISARQVSSNGSLANLAHLCLDICSAVTNKIAFSQSQGAAFSVRLSRTGKKAVAVLLILLILGLGYMFFSNGFTGSSVSDGASPNVGIVVSSLSSKCNAGDYVVFGNYPQKSGNNPEPIEWLVLEKNGNNALLLSRCALDCRQFNSSFTDTSWLDCSLRKWLNSDFLNRAFDASEQQHIIQSKVFTGDNPDFGTSGCGETRDKVFCLSIEEMNKYFTTDVARLCTPTDYAISCNAYLYSNPEFCWFWLRSSGSDARSAACVVNNGSVDSDGYNVCTDDIAVRPAVRVMLK